MVGLLSSLKQFNDQLVHAVDRYCFNEQRIDEQSKDVQRKLSQCKLEEITQKGKDKRKQAVVAPVVDVQEPLRCWG